MHCLGNETNSRLLSGRDAVLISSFTSDSRRLLASLMADRALGALGPALLFLLTCPSGVESALALASSPCLAATASSAEITAQASSGATFRAKNGTALVLTLCWASVLYKRIALQVSHVVVACSVVPHSAKVDASILSGANASSTSCAGSSGNDFVLRCDVSY